MFINRLVVPIALALALLQGCTQPQRQHGMILDGRMEEWPATAAVAADPDYLYFRVTVENEQFTLQAGPETLAIALDADGDYATGRRLYLGEHPERGRQLLGIDLEIQFSPLNPEGGPPRRGVALVRVHPDGSRTPLPRGTYDVIFTPTYASTWYEIRLSRHAAEGLILSGGMHTSGRIAGTFVILGRAGDIVGYSDPFAVVAPGRSASRPLAAATLPAKPRDAIRVMSYNVLNSALIAAPESFKAVFDALGPDAVLLQETRGVEADALESWFNVLVEAPDFWKVRKSADGDVAIATPWPLAPLGPERLTALDHAGVERDVRFVAAVASTPLGDIALASIHLKCCGSKDSPEDRRRMSEARAVNEALRTALDGGPALRVLGGDVNLVGSRPPLDLLRARLDVGGGDLAIADAFVLGDNTQYTWADEQSEFTPGRLDFLLYSGAAASVASTFVLDTMRLDEASLARMGLRAADTLGSDHLPLVVDLVPRR